MSTCLGGINTDIFTVDVLCYNKALLYSDSENNITGRLILWHFFINP